jgi:hypothetical protein
VKIDSRYRIKERPDKFNVRCPKCGAQALMYKKFEAYEQEENGGWAIKESATSIAGPITGKLTCKACGLNGKATISWPEDAYYQFDINGQTVWAWNREYLLLLKDWVAAKVRNEDDLFSLELYPDPKVRWPYIHFLANLPKFIVLNKNRDRIVKKILGLLEASEGV